MSRYSRKKKYVLGSEDQAVFEHLERARRELQSAESRCLQVLEKREASVMRAQQTLRDLRGTMSVLDRVRTLSSPYGPSPGVTDGEEE